MMKARTVIAVMLLSMISSYATAAVTISDDRGGQIGHYLAKFHALRASGEHVVIDGLCASACTMILGIVPRARICATRRAILEFHSAYDFTQSGGQAVNSDGNRILWSNYPSDVRSWIQQHGGLREQVVSLRGPELFAMYPACP
jgi:hypothetical protein